MGGFEACPGLHLEFDEWVKKRIPNPIKQKKNIIQKKKKQKHVNENENEDKNKSKSKSNSKSKKESTKCNKKFNKDVKKNREPLDDLCPSIKIENKNSKLNQNPRIKSEGDKDMMITFDTSFESVVSTDSDPESTRWKDPPCVGQFTPIRMKEDFDIINRFEHIPCHAGDLIFWDYRIPHSNSYKNTSNNVREAIYLGFLPNILLNKEYIKDQLIRFNEGIVPCDQWHSHNKPQISSYSFSSLGKKLMGLEPWI